MKRTVLTLILILALMLPCFTGLTEANELPPIGSTVHGFTVIDQYPLEALKATAVYMIHDKTKANLTYVVNDDVERAFDITFRTPGVDDKGIPHVFEHATLSGNVKYPDPSLFFSMMSQTYNTYLNAMTMQTCTTYPAASLSEEQLYVFADYILSGVFDPTIMTDERAMMREAYRYELTDKNADITLAGTVYSEMQGSLVMLGRASYNLNKTLYPGSILANIVGGDPAVIPTMTHQELIDFHDAYYHPSNSMITLYGDIDYERFLKLIDEEYLSKYDYADITLDDSAYEPFTGYREEVFTFPVAQNANAQPIAMYGIPMPNATPEDCALFAIMCDALTAESSIFMRLMRERLPNATCDISVDAYTHVPALIIAGYGIDESNKDVFKETSDEIIQRLLLDGLDMPVIETQCRESHYDDIITEGALGKGVDAAVGIGTEWARTTDPYTYKKQADVFYNLMNYVENDGFNEAFRRNLANPVSSAMAITLPDVGGLERQSEALKQRLADMKANMTGDEIDALIAKTADFAMWTQENKDNSMIDKVKVVSARTLPEEVKRYTAKDEMINGVRVVTSAVNTGDVIQVELFFDSSTIPFESLLDYSIMTMLLKHMPTENYTDIEFSDALNDAAYIPSVNASYIEQKQGGYQPKFCVSWTTTQDRLDDSFALFEELLFNVDFGNVDIIRSQIDENLLTQKVASSIMPEYFLLSMGYSLIYDDSLYNEYLIGAECTKYLRRLAGMSNDEMAELAGRMKQALDILLNKNDLIVTIVGTQESIDQALVRVNAFCEKLDDEAHEKVDYSESIPKIEGPYAAILDLTVQYNMQIMSLKESEFTESGKMIVMNELVIDKVLLPVMRFENSAYGATSRLDGDTVFVHTIRDPNLATTFEVYKKLGDMIRELDVTQDDIDGYITNVYPRLATPMNEYQGGRRAVNDALTGETTFDDRLRYMSEVKQFTPEDVTAYSVIYDRLAEYGEKVTAGGAEAIEQNRDMFKTITTMFVD